MNNKIKEQIDSMPYSVMLSRWRNAPSSDKIFHGESGKYYRKVMLEKETRLKDGEKTGISKQIGWDG